MKHPHNANQSTYETAIQKIATISQEAFSLDNVAFAMVFDTIESSAARQDAVEVTKAIWALRETVQTARIAIQKAANNATERANDLARVESNK